ncbi:MAG: 4Fe-4S binding protein [Methanocellales archaeon]|nr:4Fe-4S binding protein [Methanocellales archaeon]MDD3291513.1 4Fe-4S binding protein [Methanocellales archaeon]MDD5234597.1 4Fe-4S binding protein [Methanocellales archaeon]MDD5485050.1 4Fe-4S binding protein [Methanocellales archaeon]
MRFEIYVSLLKLIIKEVEQNMKINRRDFISFFGSTAIASALFYLVGKVPQPANASEQTGSEAILRPPSAKEEEFLSLCAMCGKCSEVCPTHAIATSTLLDGFVNIGTPKLLGEEKDEKVLFAALKELKETDMIIKAGTINETSAITKIGTIIKGANETGTNATAVTTKTSTKDLTGLCIRCMKCTEICHTGALSRQRITIDTEKCLAWLYPGTCLLCVKACPIGGVIKDDKGRAVVMEDVCTGCELCVDECKIKVIKIVPVESKVLWKWTAKDENVTAAQNTTAK